MGQREVKKKECRLNITLDKPRIPILYPKYAPALPCPTSQGDTARGHDWYLRDKAHFELYSEPVPSLSRRAGPHLPNSAKPLEGLARL